MIAIISFQSDEESTEPSDGGKANKSQTQEDDEALSSTSHRFIAHVSVPSQKEVEAALLERKKQQLLEQYASPAIKREQDKVKAMLSGDS